MLLQTSKAEIFLPELDDADARINLLFARAVEARARRSSASAGNLYDGEAGPEEMLAAFRVLIQDTPLVRFGHATANTILNNVTYGEAAIHIVDLGIGHGLQWDDLLVRLAEREVRPRVRLTGIDLACVGPSPTAALERTGARLSAVAAHLGLDFTFEAIASPIETVDQPMTYPGEALIVNAALALHHVADGDAVTNPALGRRALLRRLAVEWRPMLMTLIEPDAAHNELPFALRVSEARRHYGLVFDVLAHVFPHDPSERHTLEREFFGKEIMNVVAWEGPQRVERHDRIHTWWQKMTAAGFAPLSLGALATTLTKALELAAPFSVERRGPALSLCFGGESVIGVSAWTPA